MKKPEFEAPINWQHFSFEGAAMNACMSTTGLVQRLQFALGALVFSFFSVQQVAHAAPVVVSIDHRVTVTYSKVQFDAKKSVYSTQVRIKNRSAAALLAPLRLTLQQFDGRNVRPLNANRDDKDGQPYFEFALPKGRLAAGSVTEPVKVLFAVDKNKDISTAKEQVHIKTRLPAFTYHVSAGVELALLQPNASPSDLPANSGKKTVRFSVPLVGKFKPTATVYLRRSGDKQVIAMNDLGKDGDVTAKDGTQGVDVQIDTAKVKPDTCMQYEAFIKQGNAELMSPQVQLCVSSFPVNMAESNIASPAVFPDGSKAVADEILLTVTPTTTAAAIRQLANSIHANVVGSYMTLNLYQLKLPARHNVNQLLEIASQLKGRPSVVSAFINPIGQFALHIDDPEFSAQHGLKLVVEHDVHGLDTNAWDAGATGDGVTVVVLDSGLDRTHPDFGTAGNCQLTTDAASGVAVTGCGGTNDDSAGHGTQVAGVLAAKTNNTKGMAGVAYGSKIHAEKVSANANVVWSQMLTGFTLARDYIAGHPTEASVVNASFYAAGGSATAANWQLVCNMVEQVVYNGLPRAVVVNAVGNNNHNVVVYPARCKDLNPIDLPNPELLIAVSSSTTGGGACGADDQRESSSNFGAWVDIAAPGCNIRTTTNGAQPPAGNYTTVTGNSFAAPLVAGAAALLRSCNMLPGQIKSTLVSSANVTVTYPLDFGIPGGSTPRMDIYRALQQLNHAPSGINLSNLSVNENTATPLEVGTLTATDADTCDKHTFTIVPQPGDDSASFNIVGDKLNFNAGVTLDREAKASYTVTVHAVDFFGATPLSDTTFTITINDVDEFDVGSVVDMDAAVNSVIENSTGAVGLTASASDADATNNTITYSLVDSAGGRFAIDPGTGVVTAVGAIDREAASSYSIIVHAVSTDGSFTDQPFTIDIVDVDEYDVGALTDNDPAVNTVAESAAAGASVSVMAHASDADATNNAITYSLTDDAGGRFAIDPATGVVTVNGALDYETTPGHSYGITVQATGSDGSSSIASFGIAVTNVNEAPVANPDTLAATQDMTANYAANLMLINDTDADAGTTLTIAGVTSGSGGTAVLNGDGSVTFTPTPGFSGTATFSYIATDGPLNSNSATVTVNVAPVVPHPPVANNDTLAATEDTPVTYAAAALLGNDTDVDVGTTLAVDGVTSGAGGTAILNPDGTVTFNPNANFHGAASFTYAATDGGLTSNVATVTVNVAAMNDSATGAPVIIGTRTVGQTLTSNISTIADNDGLGTLHYQWLADGSPVGTDSGSHLLTGAEFGKFMQLRVSFTDGDGNPETRDSVLDAVAVGDPHITTVDGLHYDFQSAGEFVALRGRNGMELQLRMTPVSTATPLTDPNSGLTSGVSVNTGLAARVGDHRVTYQAEGGNAPVLRVDGVVTALSAGGLDLGGGGRVMPQGNGIQIDFPDQTTVVVSSSLWSYYSVWWVHISVFHTPAYEGIMGARKNGSWLPRLSDGSALGAMPAAMHDRYADLYVKLADSWRVADQTSLFDYAEGTSTATYTNKAWPTEDGPYVADNKAPVKPLPRKVAQLACRDVLGKAAKADCEFDVMVMGHQDVAMGHLQNQKVRLGATDVLVRAVDMPELRGVRVYIATVTRQAVATKLERRIVTTTGSVQFMLDGKPLGKPVRLDAKGQAKIKVARLKLGKQTVTARFIPAKGSMFLPSISKQAARALKPVGVRVPGNR